MSIPQNAPQRTDPPITLASLMAVTCPTCKTVLTLPIDVEPPQGIHLVGHAIIDHCLLMETELADMRRLVAELVLAEERL